MAGYVTQTRVCTEPLSRIYTWSGTPADSYRVFSEKTGPYRAGVQTTTSYRSRGDGEMRNAFGLPSNEVSSKPRLFFDTGHTFLTVKEHQPLLSHSNVKWKAGLYLLTGPLVFNRGLSGNGGESDATATWRSDAGVNLVPYGTRAIANTIPTNSIASLVQFLAELRQDFPDVPLHHLYKKAQTGHKTQVAAAIGSEYLNVMFGLIPTIRDIQKIAKAVSSVQKTVDQYIRDSGKIVRRKFYFPEEILTTVDKGTSFPGDNNMRSWGFLSSFGETTRTTVTKRRVWFSGAYTYHLDLGSSPFDQMIKYLQLSDKLYGTTFTASTAWELLPWSWLVDWISDVGSIAKVASAFQKDGLVLRYGYVMCESETTVTYRATGLQTPTGVWNPGAVVTTFRSTRKERIRATPYGFGLNPASFTAGQWSILGALGMTKAPRILR